MNINRIAVVIVASMAVGGSAIRAAEPPSYARQVKPFFARYCLECHNAEKAKGGLSLETFKGLAAGGEHGPVLVVGKPDQSRMVLQVEGKAKPHMPPRKARQPKPDEIGVLRAWIAAGAKNDAHGLAKIRIPDVKPRVPTRAAIAALAYRPDGKLLAAGDYREVALIDVDLGDVVGRLSGLAGEVTALAFSMDGHWLAVASGESGRAGEVWLYAVTGGQPATQPTHVLHAHKDEVLGLAFRPDGKVLATCGYDRLVKLWDAATGRELRTLKDHSDAVYGVAFSPDGKLLASGSADRAVKVWEADTGRRLYTLGQSTDWVYTVAWSPDGRHLAAAGVDRSIRIWRVSESSGHLVSATFAHEKPVIRLIYSTDGRTLYSLSEDRTAKAWDSARMVERTVYARQPEAVLALAVRPDQKQLALGRYDGTVLLIDPTSGKVLAEPLPAKPRPPRLVSIAPAALERGKKVSITLTGNHLEHVTKVVTNYPGVVIHVNTATQDPHRLQADLTFPASTLAGVYKLHVRSPAGQSADLALTVDAFSATLEQEPNDSATTAQSISLPTTVVGKLGRAGDVDYYRFEAGAGQQIGVQAIVGGSHDKFDPVLELTDHTGRVLTESSTGLLGYMIQQPGTYAVGIRDNEYRGGDKMAYRLHIGKLPIVTGVFPLGLQLGTAQTIHVKGVNLGNASAIKVQVQAPAGATPGTWLPLPISTPLGKPLGNARVVVGEYPEVIGQGDATARDTGTMPVPGTANGRITEPGATATWRFAAKQGQRLIVEVHARRLGSPLDSFIEILDAQGQPLPRATLRCVSQTFTAFRDHDSSGAGIRLESWNDLAVNDYLLVGTELMKIWELPRNPDDDAQFYSHNGRRIAFLGTTPTYHSLGTPMYKVEIHPP
ncbi:MAG TPA: c-type cytochrome domain-containing protein, partial [Gemmataceae bacterium]|nr:c-type cytochrome domain-containing protein [Gemmataceae bacterium]